MTRSTYRCPEYDGVSDELSPKEFDRKFRSLPSPERFAMHKDDGMRMAMFQVWLVEVQKKGSQMTFAQRGFRADYPAAHFEDDSEKRHP